MYAVTDCCIALLNNIDFEVHVAVAGATKVIAGGDETTGLLRCNADFRDFAWLD